VLWIGYLQWHFKLHGKRTPPEPILRAFQNIQCRDAVLAYDGEPQPVTWAMALENPDVPGLPEDVREQLRSSRREEALTENQESQSLLTSSPTVIKTWDRRSMKTDMLTGREVPDETKRVPLLAYANPRHVSRSAGVRRLRFVLVAQGGHAGARGERRNALA
jgi:hypothetical protein